MEMKYDSAIVQGRHFRPALGRDFKQDEMLDVFVGHDGTLLAQRAVNHAIASSRLTSPPLFPSGPCASRI
jgi:hypothetical protein